MDWLDTLALWIAGCVAGIDAALRDANHALRPIDRASDAVRALALRVLYYFAGDPPPRGQKKLE